MSGKNGGDGAERRQFARLPVVEGLIEPITLQLGGGESGPVAVESQPAILTNLSAGGMSLVMFMAPPRAKRLELVLAIPGFAEVPVEGRVVRIVEKGQTYNVGIAFTKISKKHQQQISDMAQDNADCDTRVSLGLPEACVKTCSFHQLCVKPQKSPFWPKK
jgi:hypothetical protein